MTEDIEQLKARLRQDLLPRSDGPALASAILQFLNSADRKTKREVLADDLAKHLSNHPLFSRQRKFVERLIDNRPAELNAVVKQSSWDEMNALVAMFKQTGWKPSRPRRIQSDQERASRRRASKKRHEEIRRTHGKISLIEREFSSHFVPLLGIPTHNPYGPCLDGLFMGGEVSMSSGIYPLTSLLGVSRKLLPPSLPVRREGRAFLYDYRALLICMEVLLRGHTWLTDAETRRTVLTGVIRRAQAVGSSDIATAVEVTLSVFVI